MNLTLLQFLVALFTSLSGLSLFMWAVFSGQFNDIESAKYRAFHSEVEKDSDESEQ